MRTIRVEIDERCKRTVYVEVPDIDYYGPDGPPDPADYDAVTGLNEAGGRMPHPPDWMEAGRLWAIDQFDDEAVAVTAAQRQSLVVAASASGVKGGRAPDGVPVARGVVG